MLHAFNEWPPSRPGRFTPGALDQNCLAPKAAKHLATSLGMLNRAASSSGQFLYRKQTTCPYLQNIG